MCNKLASRHVRVGLANPSAVPRCDICENAPAFVIGSVCSYSENCFRVAFFYCEIDGSSLCLQCDVIVHVGGKKTHGRYLLLRQRVEFPGDTSVEPSENGRGQNQLTIGENQQNHKVSPFKTDSTKMIDLNMKPPHRIHGQASNNQVQNRF
ncbi:hypothetical protein Gohar_018146 [Gossypium harknessii]|uniref:B box-type domain-containing protein n=1 Tax=Gossypium harknessii TaxID=34285 RepID=A0A7J9G889_9ROSI|nr:hypothetical protein [Gossypium harknessii]